MSAAICMALPLLTPSHHFGNSTLSVVSARRRFATHWPLHLAILGGIGVILRQTGISLQDTMPLSGII